MSSVFSGRGASAFDVTIRFGRQSNSPVRAACPCRTARCARAVSSVSSHSPCGEDFWSRSLVSSRCREKSPGVTSLSMPLILGRIHTRGKIHTPARVNKTGTHTKRICDGLTAVHTVVSRRYRHARSQTRRSCTTRHTHIALATHIPQSRSPTSIPLAYGLSR